ncbi:PAS domain S-box protein, partial [candidate division KSB1 bacterium]
LEHIHFDKYGNKRYVEIHGFPILDDENNVSQMIEYTLDITKRREAEEALAESEAKWRSLVENSPDHITLLDNSGKILFINHTVPGLTKEQVIGTSFFDYALPEYREITKACFDRVLRSSAPDKFESIYQSEDGARTYFESHVGPVIKAGVVIGFTVSSRDVTERQQMQEALKRSHDDLQLRVDQRTRELEETNAALRAEIIDHQQAEAARAIAERRLEEQRIIAMRSDRLRSLGEMATGIAHELNQPLVGVRGLAEHLLIGLDRGWDVSEDKLREKLSLIIEQADRMSHIIDHVRLFARSADKQEMHRIRVNEVVLSALELLKSQLQARAILLESTLCPADCHVLANPFSLEEVILNLLINARDAVEARISHKDETAQARIELKTRLEQKDKKRVIKIEITDNGMGIKREILTKVFDPFFTTKEPDRGTGLGLTIAKSIIEQFGGILKLKSVYRHGTTVTITLPTLDE